MTKIRYRNSALKDLQDIEKYYAGISENTNGKVFSDIYSAIEVLKMFPKAGRALTKGRRRYVSSKYSFIISYKTDVDIVEIIGVYRYQNR